MPTLYLLELAEARAELLRVYNRVEHPDAQADGGWSARQIMHHLFLSENGIARMFRAYERVTTRVEAYSDDALERERDMLQELAVDRSVKVQAPERLRPLELDPEVDVLRELSGTRDVLVTAAQQLSDDVMREHVFAHPIRGNLSLYGWLWFVAAHERRHTEQLRALL